MLLIFDLDDTLVDTHSLTQIKLRDALHRMIEAGLILPDPSESLNLLKRLDQAFLSARDTLREFIEMHDFDAKYLEIGLQEIYSDLSPEVPVRPLERAPEILSELQMSHQLALVTLGNAERQMAKMEKAGIDSGLFSKIIVTEERNKKPHYEAIAQEFSALASSVIVCGDRIPLDLTPAKELGFRTVQMLWGRGRVHFGNKGDVDYSISTLAEIKDIIEGLVHGYK